MEENTSFIQTLLSPMEFHHVSLRLVGYTTGKEFHLSLKFSFIIVSYLCYCQSV